MTGLDVPQDRAAALTATPKTTDVIPATASTPAPSPAAGALLIPADAPLPPARRLVVLVPDADVDQAEFASLIWSLASPRWLDVLYLGLIRDPLTEEASARRQLASLAAITRDDRAKVEIRLETARGWIPAVRKIWREGDLVICHAEQRVRKWGRPPQPLAQALMTTLNAPVYVLSGLSRARPSASSNRALRGLRDISAIVIIIVFLALQVQIQRLADPQWLVTVLLSLSVCAEFGLIWIWNHHLNLD